ncbi:MAG: dihydrofolate reductase family protein [Chthoniobacteraceae bacterium]
MAAASSQQKLPRPFVTANFAVTADGRISTRNFTPSDFSSKSDKRRLVKIRAACDAVLVGARTLASDTMTLGIPGIRAKKPPLRVIVSNSGRIDPMLRVFQTPGAPIVIFTTRKMPAKTRDALAQVADIFINPTPEVDLALALTILRVDYGVKRLVCEGGGTLLRSFAAADLLDEIHLTLCPIVFGGSGAPTLTGVPGKFLPKSVQLRLIEMKRAGDECFTRWSVERRASSPATPSRG